MAFIPSMLLKQLYTRGSLQNSSGGFQFAIKNRLSDAELTQLQIVSVDGQTIPNERVHLYLDDGQQLKPEQITSKSPLAFPLRKAITIHVTGEELERGKHMISVGFKAKPFGELKFDVEDAIAEQNTDLLRVPRDPNNDYGPEIIKTRQQFVEQIGRAHV